MTRNLDLTGRQIRVHRLRRSRHYGSVDAHHALGAKSFEVLETWRARMGDQLGDPVVIAEIDEQQAAMIALAMEPAAEANPRSFVGQTQRAAGVSAIACIVKALGRPRFRKARKGRMGSERCQVRAHERRQTAVFRVSSSVRAHIVLERSEKPLWTSRKSIGAIWTGPTAAPAGRRPDFGGRRGDADISRHVVKRRSSWLRNVEDDSDHLAPLAGFHWRATA